MDRVELLVHLARREILQREGQQKYMLRLRSRPSENLVVVDIRSCQIVFLELHYTRLTANRVYGLICMKDLVMVIDRKCVFGLSLEGRSHRLQKFTSSGIIWRRVVPTLRAWDEHR